MNTQNPYQVGEPNNAQAVKFEGCMENDTKDDTYFRSMSVHAVCGKCSAAGPTHVKQAYGLLTCLFAIFCGCYYTLYAIHKNKDTNCKNAEHRCGKCNEVIYTYSSC